MLDLLGRSTAVSHEEAFLRRYDALVLVALRVTGGDRQEAEDLVHEAFIRFTLVQPPLDEVYHLDAYLSRMLRNMYTSRIRRRLRAAETSLSILDYDSLDIGFHAMDTSAALEVRETLRAACEYGCVRKRSSKTGSVFLLRFFHGYLPSEIASVARLSPAIVDALIFRARREVKVYVERPNQLAFIGGRDAQATSKVVAFPNSGGEAPHSEHAFVHELRARIFTDTHERCWSKKTLRDRYRDPTAEALSRDALADLIGCPTCLDATNTLLGLPRLADRWPADTLGPGTRGGPGGRGGGGPVASIASGRRKARAVFEHRPRELCVSVNGFVIGAHTIGAHDSDLTLSVNLSEPIALIELLSEQGLCLVFLDIVPPPHGDARQRRRVELSDGRSAELEVTFDGPWPSVRASYSDPRRAIADYVDEELAGDEGEGEPTQTVTSFQWRRPRLFGLRPASATALLVPLLIWLLFWTPGTTVSAAERLADTIKWLVGAVFGSQSSTTTPAVPTPGLGARDISLPLYSAVAPSKPAGLSSARRTYLELKALAELHHVDAYLGQELSLAERNGARVQVQAIVDTKARGQALLAALGPLVADPDLTARITTLDDVASRSRRQPAATIETQSFRFAGDEFPMFATVRRYLMHRERFQREESGAASASPADNEKVDAETRGFASELLARSRRASQHAWALKHLGDRFPAPLIDQASEDAREIWRALIRDHARAYRQEIALLSRDLEPVARTIDAEAGRSDSSEAMPSSSADDTWSQIERLLDAHRRHEAAIQHAFAMQAGAADEVDAVQSAAFWASIDSSEMLAAAIARDP